jgi:hypothetical protein
MKLQLRDALWLTVLLVLLLGWLLDGTFTQHKTALLTHEIQQLESKSPPIRFINADFRSAIYYLDWRLGPIHKRRIRIDLDETSLRKVGLRGPIKVNCDFDSDAIPKSIEQMVPGKIVVTETPEGFLVSGRVQDE